MLINTQNHNIWAISEQNLSINSFHFSVKIFDFDRLLKFTFELNALVKVC